jgi:hypothetical protein
MMSHIIINPTAGFSSPSPVLASSASSSVLEEDYAARWHYGDDSVADLAKQVALWVDLPVDKKKKKKAPKCPAQPVELFPVEVPAPALGSPSQASLPQRVRALSWALALLLRTKLRKEFKKVVLPVGACFGLGLLVLYIMALKDIVLKNKEEYLDPTPEGYVKLSNELAGPYKIEGITADIVMWKFRTKTFKKWLRRQEGTVNKKRKRESSSSASSDNSSDSYSDSFSDSESIDQDPVSYRVQQPVFWSLSDSDFTWYFMRRKWKIEVKHFAGNQYLELEYKIDPPTVFELQNLLKKSKQPSLKSLDLNKPNLQNQVKEWKPIT